MVQEKDAAVKRAIAREAYKRKVRSEIEQNTIRVKWQVIERTPGYNTGGYYDQDVPEKNVIVADNFETEQAAQLWMDGHEADKGKSLHIKKRRLVRRYVDTWF